MLIIWAVDSRVQSLIVTRDHRLSRPGHRDEHPEPVVGGEVGGADPDPPPHAGLDLRGGAEAPALAPPPGVALGDGRAGAQEGCEDQGQGAV